MIGDNLHGDVANGEAGALDEAHGLGNEYVTVGVEK